MQIVTNKARAYVNFGRVIADCPLDCGNAVKLEPNQTSMFCQGSGGCGHIAEIEWPSNIDEILEALSKRKAPKNQNWFPSGHPLALRAGCPHGQTVAELEQETADYTGA